MKDSKKYLIVNRWISSAFNSFAWVAFSLKCTPIILKYPFRPVFLSKIPGLPQYWSPPLSVWDTALDDFFWGGGRAGAELHYVDIVPASFPPRNWKSKCQPWFVRSFIDTPATDLYETVLPASRESSFPATIATLTQATFSSLFSHWTTVKDRERPCKIARVC